jgi:hypothetical protein
MMCLPAIEKYIYSRIPSSAKICCNSLALPSQWPFALRTLHCLAVPHIAVGDPIQRSVSLHL